VRVRVRVPDPRPVRNPNDAPITTGSSPVRPGGLYQPRVFDYVAETSRLSSLQSKERVKLSFSAEPAGISRIRTAEAVVGRARAHGVVPEGPDAVADADLLCRMAADDAGALDMLLERHWAAVFRYVERRTGSRDQAADVAQEVFCRLWERRAAWQADGSVRGLLLRLARNTAVSEHRRQEARARATTGYAELYVERSAPMPAERAELRAALERAVAALSPRRREVFLLRMQDDLSYDEIADVMGTTRQTVANQLSQALAALRETLADLLD
jgi:RNA polymerase sigma-70 factor, ECF subfamily